MCTDDLGRIYGVQSREWKSPNRVYVDQLKKVYDNLNLGIDDRREIVSHWNPGELDQMALPPCHMFYQFGLRDTGFPRVESDDRGSYLDLMVYIRSNDMGLGMPFNIAGYAWLLHTMARITGNVPGELHYFAWNYHIYENHIGPLEEQLRRSPRMLPFLTISQIIRTLEDVDEIAIVDDFHLEAYNPHPPIKMKMAI